MQSNYYVRMLVNCFFLEHEDSQESEQITKVDGNKIRNKL